MKEKISYLIWKKGENLTLNNYFNTKEFNYQCKYSDCVEQRINLQLFENITKIREEIKSPLIITSGFRCEKHQNDLRNQGVNTVVAKKSTHELGDAVDIQSKIIKINDLLVISEKFFDSIGIAKTFLHVDMRIGKRRWNY